MSAVQAEAGHARAAAGDRLTVLSRLVGLLTRSPCGNRALDHQVARVLGWETKIEAGTRYWRRWRLGWTRGDGHSVPPRYTTSLDALLAELPGDTVVTLWINQGPCRAQIGADGGAAGGDGDAAQSGTGCTVELGLAAAVVGARMFAVPDGSAS